MTKPPDYYLHRAYEAARAAYVIARAHPDPLEALAAQRALNDFLTGVATLEAELALGKVSLDVARHLR